MIELVILGLLLLFAVIVLMRTVRIVPQQTALIIERLGRYHSTLEGGIHFLVPFVDKVRANIDLREQVVSFPPQPVITSDNLVVNIDTVIYYSVIDAKSAVYEIANFIQGIEQLTVTTLRNVIGSLDLEQTLTSRDQINAQLRGVLDEATGKWGIRVNRVELKAIDPPMSIQESMEKQMKAERERRAIILTAEGSKQSNILTAEGEKQSQILRAEGSAQARVLEAQGQARAIQQVFDAIHRGKPTQKLLAYQYLQVLPQIARGDSNKMWIIPSELTDALKGIGGALGRGEGGGGFDDSDTDEWQPSEDLSTPFDDTVLADPAQALAEARGEAGDASREAADHATPPARQQPPLTPPADAVPPRTAPADPAAPTDPAPPREKPEVGAAEAALILVAGILAGTINTVVGSGTLVTFPTLLFFGFAPVTANVSNTVGLIAGGLTGSWGYRHELGGMRPTLLRWAPMSLLGGVVGALLLLVLDPAAFRTIVPVLIGIGVLLVAFGPRITAWSTSRRGDAPPTALGDHSRRRALLLAFFVFATAIYGGYFGAAQGVILMGLLTTLTSESLQILNGIKNVLATIVNAVAALTFVIVAPEQVDWTVAGLIAAGSLVGGVIGSRVGRRLPPNVLRAVIVVIGVVAIARMVWAS